MFFKSIAVLEDDAGITKTKIRGVLSLLKQSGVLITINQDDGSPVKLKLDHTISSIRDLRTAHDSFLETFMGASMLRSFNAKDRKSIVWENDEKANDSRIEELLKFEKIAKKAFNADKFTAYVVKEEGLLAAQARQDDKDMVLYERLLAEKEPDTIHDVIVAMQAQRESTLADQDLICDSPTAASKRPESEVESSNLQYIPMDTYSGE
jgi:hypothetical protein